MHSRASDYLCSRLQGRSDAQRQRSQRGPRFRLYRAPKRRTYTIYDGLLTPHNDSLPTYIASHPPPLWVRSTPFRENKEASPQKKRREAYNAIARPQEPWAQEGGRYYTNLTYSIQEVNPEESDGSRLRMTSPAKGEKPPQEAEERIRLGA